jgi:hypothetical protein
MNREVAVYKGDELLCMGSISQCAKKLGVKVGTIYFYLMPSYRKRVNASKHPEMRIIAVRTDVLGGDD